MAIGAVREVCPFDAEKTVNVCAQQRSGTPVSPETIGTADAAPGPASDYIASAAKEAFARQGSKRFAGSLARSGTGMSVAPEVLKTADAFASHASTVIASTLAGAFAFGGSRKAEEGTAAGAFPSRPFVHKRTPPGSGEARVFGVQSTDGFAAALRLLAEAHAAGLASLQQEISDLEVKAKLAALGADAAPARPRAEGTGEPEPAQEKEGQHEPAFEFHDSPGAASTRSLEDASEGSGITSPVSKSKGLELVRRKSEAMTQVGEQMDKEAATAARAACKQRALFAIDSFIGVVIILNAAVLGISTDVDPEGFGWIVTDGIFAAIFLVELLVKLRLLGPMVFVNGSDKLTNLFEAALVLLAVIEFGLALAQHGKPDKDKGDAQLMPLLRTIRLFRVLRVLRVMRLEIFKELKLMVQGMIGGMRTLLWSMFIIVLPVYSVCLVFREGLGKIPESGHGARYFDSVPRSFFTVFRCVVVGECGDAGGRPLLVLITEQYGWGWGAIFSMMSVFMTFGLFNVIVAMFVENVVESGKSREREARRVRMRDDGFFAKKILELLQVIWECQNTSQSAERQAKDVDIYKFANEMDLTPDVFDALMLNPRIRRILDELDIADDDQYNLFVVLDADGSGNIGVGELCDGILKLRGDSCRSDIIAINFMLQGMQAEAFASRQDFLRRFQCHEDSLEEIQATLRGNGQDHSAGRPHAVLCKTMESLENAKLIL